MDIVFKVHLKAYKLTISTIILKGGFIVPVLNVRVLSNTN